MTNTTTLWGADWTQQATAEPGTEQPETGISTLPMGTTPRERLSFVLEAIAQGRADRIRMALTAQPTLLNPFQRRLSVLRALADTQHPLGVADVLAEMLDKPKAIPLGAKDMALLFHVMVSGRPLLRDGDATTNQEFARALEQIWTGLGANRRVGLEDAQKLFTEAFVRTPIGALKALVEVLAPTFTVAQLWAFLDAPKTKNSSHESLDGVHHHRDITQRAFACCQSDPVLARWWCTQVWGVLGADKRARILSGTMAMWRYGGVTPEALLGLDAFARMSDDTAADVARGIEKCPQTETVHASVPRLMALLGPHLEQIPGVVFDPAQVTAAGLPGPATVHVAPKNLINILGAHRASLMTMLQIVGACHFKRFHLIHVFTQTGWCLAKTDENVCVSFLQTDARIWART